MGKTNAMTDRQSSVLFYTLLTVIVAANLIFVGALFRHFMLDVNVPNIQWIHGGFGVESVAGFFLGWRVVIGSSSADKGGEPHVIQRMNYPENLQDPWVIKKNLGVAHLEKAVDNHQPPARRKAFASQALRLFQAVPKNAPAYLGALYDPAIALRELGNYDEALRAYDLIDYLVQTSFGREFAPKE
jgi:hypothetical protein